MSGRRDAGRSRGKFIQDAILRATLEEIAHAGIAGVSVARIAERAEVNKTTIYRRWPTIDALVEAAITSSLTLTTEELEDQGSLKDDLGQLVRALADRLDQPSGRALTVMAVSGQSTELLGRGRDDGMAESLGVVITRAIERGEWDAGSASPEILVEMMVGALVHRLLMEKRVADPAWVASLAGMLARSVHPLPEDAT